MSTKSDSDDGKKVVDVLSAINTAPRELEVWVCPNCGGWFGSSSSSGQNLDTIHNYRTSMRNATIEDPSEWGKSTGTRAICQVCQQSGRGNHERVRVRYARIDTVISIEEVGKQVEQINKSEASAGRKEDAARQREVQEVWDQYGHGHN